MPTYEYRCLDCCVDFTVEAKMSDAPPVKSPTCVGDGCRIEKKISRVTGWVKNKTAYMRAPSASASIASQGSRTATLAPLAPQKDEVPETSLDPVHLCSKYCDLHN